MAANLSDLVAMTRTLGDPARKLVIIGEGNTSARIDKSAFWVKASGQQMHSIDDSGFVAMQFAPILDLLDASEEVQGGHDSIMLAAKVEPDSPARPSVEASFHAILLAECGAQYVAHTHPVVINQIMCSERAGDFAYNRMFPDEVVLCGPISVLVPYTDPGLPLAIEIRKRVAEFIAKYGEAPKVILLQNHGLIALASSPTEALNITAMCVKAAEIFVGACQVGGPTFMSKADIMHIYRRPDEIYRRARFVDNK